MTARNTRLSTWHEKKIWRAGRSLAHRVRWLRFFEVADRFLIYHDAVGVAELAASARQESVGKRSRSLRGPDIGIGRSRAVAGGRGMSKIHGQCDEA